MNIVLKDEVSELTKMFSELEPQARRTVIDLVKLLRPDKQNQSKPKGKRIADLRRYNNDFFACDRTNVMVQADWFHAGNIANNLLQFRPSDFDQLGSNLLQEIAAFVDGHGFDKVLFRCSQYALQTNN